MDLPLATGVNGRTRLGLPQARFVNAYTEKTPAGPTSAVRTARAGLTLQYTCGTGPILSTYVQPGLEANQANTFHVSGAGMYQGNTFLGSIAYSQTPRMAGANGFLSIVSGGGLYTYDGTNFMQKTTYDDGISILPPFSGCAVLYDIFVYPLVGSNEFLFSKVGNPSSLNAANISAAQVTPSQIVEVQVLAEELYFFKQDTVEIWDYSGQLTAPFALSQGRTYQRGCIAQASVKRLDNGLFWVADNLTVYRTGSVPQRVSNSFIEERLQACGATNLATMTALTYSLEGHEFYVINIPVINESYAYDCQTEQWARWGTQTGLQFDPGLFLGATAGGYGANTVIGSAIDGRVFSPDPLNRTDGGTPMQVVIAAAYWINAGTLRCNNVTLKCRRGIGSNTVSPKVLMRYSDDGGETYSSWYPGQLYFAGQYKYRTTWRHLGLIKEPGRIFEFMVSDPYVVALEGATMNEARP